jgi:hypothetical protein
VLFESKNAPDLSFKCTSKRCETFYASCFDCLGPWRTSLVCVTLKGGRSPVPSRPQYLAGPCRLQQKPHRLDLAYRCLPGLDGHSTFYPLCHYVLPFLGGFRIFSGGRTPAPSWKAWSLIAPCRSTNRVQWLNTQPHTPTLSSQITHATIKFFHTGCGRMLLLPLDRD